MTPIIEQHLAWLRLYAVEMKPQNWRDMRDRIETQIEKLEVELRGHR
jgi:hypothetical protein